MMSFTFFGRGDEGGGSPWRGSALERRAERRGTRGETPDESSVPKTIFDRFSKGEKKQ